LTELSWKRVSHPSEVLKVGDEIDVFVLGVDRINRKVSLGLKELQPDPWVEATQLYGVGQIVKGKVARLVKFGAFIELEKGLEGLCHISELSAKPVARPEDAVKPGDQVTVKILRVLPEEQKIGLSIKEVQMEEEKQRAKAEQEEKTKVTIEDVLKEKTEKK
jgi:4-hydroxy-3-methylbut-2-enyl diphosphate reductase